jgi:hypothetical protein
MEEGWALFLACAFISAQTCQGLRSLSSKALTSSVAAWKIWGVNCSVVASRASHNGVPKLLREYASWEHQKL